MWCLTTPQELFSANAGGDSRDRGNRETRRFFSLSPLLAGTTRNNATVLQRD